MNDPLSVLPDFKRSGISEIKTLSRKVHYRTPPLPGNNHLFQNSPVFFQNSVYSSWLFRPISADSVVVRISASVAAKFLIAPPKQFSPTLNTIRHVFSSNIIYYIYVKCFCANIYLFIYFLGQ